MYHLARRGFSLIELMIALVLLGIVSAAVYKIMVSDQRIFRAQTQRIDLQENIRAAATILPAEFRVLNARDGDILAIGPDSIKIRAMRLFAVACDTPIITVAGAITARTLIIRNSLTFGSRMLAANDSVLIYYEGAPGNRNDDGWLRGQVTLAPVAANCAGPEPIAQARPGMLLTFDLAAFVLPQQQKPGMIPMGTPVWGYEIDTYRVYQAADAKWYLGQRIGNGALQPLVGPLLGANGITLSYFDSTGTVTAATASIGQIEVRVRGLTAEPIRLTDGTQTNAVDSMVTRVALRNNRRF
jgi:prepilin-type N-terminal cleavage/methylation domain-containing protein